MTTYPVSKIFRTLQGEGHFVGYPAVFIRLAGCSVLGCSIRSECDEAPWKAAETLTSVEVAARAAFFNPGGIAVITGGEPTDHDLIPLVCGLKDMGMRVHLETSGVRSVDGYPLDWITVSPKLPGYAQRSGHALKVVVRPSWTWKQVAALDEGTTFFHRYLQPLTMSDGSSNLAEVVALLDQVQGSRWALSVQAHKQWGLP